MIRHESSILLTHCNTQEDILNCCRLIHTVDAYHEDDVYSVFLTTRSRDVIDEEFVYDIAHDESKAVDFFTLVCREHVTACTLRDIARDFLAEA